MHLPQIHFSKPSWGAVAIALLIFFTIGVIVLAQYLNYSLVFLDENSESSGLNLACRERVSGQVSINKPDPQSTLLLTLTYYINTGSDKEPKISQKSVSQVSKSHKYSISVFGQPAKERNWNLVAYYFDKDGKVIQSGQSLEGVSCDQEMSANLVLE